MTLLLDQGIQFSAALDPHRRAAYQRALVDTLTLFETPPSITVLGWQATTLIDIFYDHVSRIVIIENDPRLLVSIMEGIEKSDRGKRIKVLNADPKNAKIKEKTDIVLLTHSSTWFIEGPSAAILDSARKHLLKPGGQLIPQRFVHLFELACSPAGLGGFDMRVPRYMRPGEPVPLLSESKHWATNDFSSNTEISHKVEDTIIVKSLLSGTLTGLRLSTLVEVSKDNIYLASHLGYQKIFMPLVENISVEAGKLVEIFIKYRFGEELENTIFRGRVIDNSPKNWDLRDHEITESFRIKIRSYIDYISDLGRIADLDKVVSYTVDPHGDVSRLTAMFWTIDEEFRKPVNALIDSFRSEISQVGSTPSDDTIYDLMLETYRKYRKK